MAWFYKLINSVCYTAAVYVLFINFFGCVVCAVTYWKLYEKAGYPGHKVLVPVESSFIFGEILYGNGWIMLGEKVLFIWALFDTSQTFLAFLLDGFVLLLAVWNIVKLARCYGKTSPLFIVGLLLFPAIFSIPMAFSEKVQYQGAVRDGTSYEELKEFFRRKVERWQRKNTEN